MELDVLQVDDEQITILLQPEPGLEIEVFLRRSVVTAPDNSVHFGKLYDLSLFLRGNNLKDKVNLVYVSEDILTKKT